MLKTFIAGIFGLIILFLIPKSVLAATYYVATTGSDSGTGSFSSPWKSVSFGVNKLTPGDTLYIKGGIYNSTFSVNTNGTATSPITISGAPGESAIFDGNKTNPSGPNSYFVAIRGNYVTLKDLEIANSGGAGVFSSGQYVTVRNLKIHHAQGAAITLTGSFDLAEGNQAWQDGLMNENNKSGVTGGWPAIVTCARYPEHCTLRGNTVHDSWGEGISTFEANYTTFEDNISYNNQQNFYISDTKYTMFRRNLSYCTPGNAIDPYMTQNGILVGDEKGALFNGVRMTSSDNQIINNIVMGCDRNLAAGTKVSTNSIYANNTFVNSGGDASERANVLIYSAGSCTNCKFINNLILQEGSIPITLGGGSGWSYSNNLWSRSPGSTMSGTGDVIGNPQIAKFGSILPGQLTGNYFKLLATSPAINKATAITQVTEDYFKNQRNSPDMGAIEYNGSTGIQPKAGDVNSDGRVDIVDIGIIIDNYGKSPIPNPKADVNSDGVVDIVDIGITIDNYGK